MCMKYISNNRNNRLKLGINSILVSFSIEFRILLYIISPIYISRLEVVAPPQGGRYPGRSEAQNLIASSIYEKSMLVEAGFGVCIANPFVTIENKTWRTRFNTQINRIKPKI